MRTIIYVDGFNLYYRALKQRPQYKWLNLKRLAEEVLDPINSVEQVNFYTARISARVNPTGPRDQQIYFDALATIPEVKIHFGNFQVNNTYARIPPFPDGKKELFKPWPTVVRIIKTEEKGSDVNLGVHLVRDACLGRFDVAAVITNDTDLVEPIRIAVNELSKTVGIISPVENPARSLQDVASFVRRIRPTHLLRAQFPNPLARDREPDLNRPLDWCVQNNHT